MKIIGIKHFVDDNNKVDEYLEKIAVAVSYQPDIVFGPDYALRQYTNPEKRLIDFNARRRVIKKLEELSIHSSGTLIVPGTCPVKISDTSMMHSALIFKGGRLIGEFYKETDRSDSKIAERHGLKYVRGDCTSNHIMHNDKKIAVEICSDHGHQPINRNIFLELILARDQSAGFWANRPPQNTFARYGAVSDSKRPFVDCQYFNPKADEKLSFIEGKKLNSDLYEFELIE